MQHKDNHEKEKRREVLDFSSKKDKVLGLSPHLTELSVLHYFFVPYLVSEIAVAAFLTAVQVVLSVERI